MNTPYVTRELPLTKDGEWVTRYEGEYEFLSNFYPHTIYYLHEAYPTLEHAYQAAKFSNEDLRVIVRALPTPADARRYARNNKARQIKDFGEIKIPVMFALNWQKFQDQHMWVALDNTGKALLVEGNEWGDKFWGVCQGEGLNHLGRIQMRIRLMHHFEDICGELAPELDLEKRVYTERRVQEAWKLFHLGALQGLDTDYRRILL